MHKIEIYTNNISTMSELTITVSVLIMINKLLKRLLTVIILYLFKTPGNYSTSTLLVNRVTNSLLEIMENFIPL